MTRSGWRRRYDHLEMAATDWGIAIWVKTGEERTELKAEIESQ